MRIKSSAPSGGLVIRLITAKSTVVIPKPHTGGHARENGDQPRAKPREDDTKNQKGQHGDAAHPSLGTLAYIGLDMLDHVTGKKRAQCKEKSN
jgi:hypothetical protein